MGVPLVLLTAFGVLRATVSLKNRTDEMPVLEMLLLAFIIPYLLFIGIHKVKFTRHLLILYPALTVLAAVALASACGGIKGGNRWNSVILQWGGRVVLGIVVVYSFIYTAAFAGTLLAKPTKLEVTEWVAEHIPPEESVSGVPVALFTWLLPDVDVDVEDVDAEWVLILVPDFEVFQKYEKNPQGYAHEDWYPLGEIGLAEALAFYGRVLGEGSAYQLHKVFRCTPQFLGIHISDTGAPFPMRALAHPEFLLYRR